MRGSPLYPSIRLFIVGTNVYITHREADLARRAESKREPEEQVPLG